MQEIPPYYGYPDGEDVSEKDRIARAYRNDHKQMAKIFRPDPQAHEAKMRKLLNDQLPPCYKCQSKNWRSTAHHAICVECGHVLSVNWNEPEQEK